MVEWFSYLFGAKDVESAILILPGTAISLAGHVTLFLAQPSLGYTTVKWELLQALHEKTQGSA